MPSAPLRLTRAVARRFMRAAQGLDAPFASVEAALAHLAYVQIDPIDVCGKMHDLILRNRVVAYRAGDLLRHVHEVEPRRAFEHYLPGSGVLCAMPITSLPYLLPGMKERSRRASGWAGKLSTAESRLAKRILAEIEARGPLTSDDIDHDARAETAWGSGARMAKTVLEKLHVHGRVLIANRRGFRRVYDLPERLVPPQLLDARPNAAEIARFRALARLQQRRLAPLGRAELPFVEDMVHAVRFDEGPLLYCLKDDLPLLDAESPRDPLLLAPLDPLIYDRKVTLRLWDLDYRWEVYTPPAKRVRGYYALPILTGDQIVGWVDPKADRARGVLEVVARSAGRSPTSALASLAGFLGLTLARRSV